MALTSQQLLQGLAQLIQQAGGGTAGGAVAAPASQRFGFGQPMTNIPVNNFSAPAPAPQPQGSAGPEGFGTPQDWNRARLFFGVNQGDPDALAFVKGIQNQDPDTLRFIAMLKGKRRQA